MPAQSVPPADPYAPPAADVDDMGWMGPAPARETVVASRGLRFAGSFVDGIIDGIIYGTLFWMHGQFTIQVRREYILGVFLIACVQWYLIATRGQSIGKMAVGTQIVRRDGSPAGFVAGVALRSWIIGGLIWAPPVLAALGVTIAQRRVFSYATEVLWLVDALFIFGSERLCLHDYIAGTKVIVQLPAQPPPAHAPGRP